MKMHVAGLQLARSPILRTDRLSVALPFIGVEVLDLIDGFGVYR
jgi:hypothetical protein